MHTSYSFDAYAWDTRNDPEAAYKFARGEPMAIAPLNDEGKGTVTIQLDRPLDFAAVTDHSEFLGEVDLCITEGSESYDTAACRLYRRGGPVSVVDMSSRIMSPHPTRNKAICGRLPQSHFVLSFYSVMSSRTHSRPMYLAPGVRSSARVGLPGGKSDLCKVDFPAPDEHSVEPETYQEMLDGQVIQVAPSEPPHADRQFDIAYSLRAHVADGYVGSTELLTRVSEHNDFATDACIRKQGTDADGHRYLEELSFEVKHKQSEVSLKKRARYLIERGVRRVFAIYVQAQHGGSSARKGRVTAGPVKEWSAKDDCWLSLADDSYIEDPCLRRPLKVRALTEAIEADNAVARALLDKENPVALELKADIYNQGYDQGASDGYNRGKSDGLRQAIRVLCQTLNIALTPEHNARLHSFDADELQTTLGQIQKTHSWNLE
ncbi:MAG: DUF3604 domain-containing protein [Proteobacteria bacterium]|nr:DUF3604 domain-containing protein [Pseudomonadota bacterium]